MLVSAAALGGCARRGLPAGRQACCAAPAYTRAQVQRVLGAPAPPSSSKWHPFPSPPPNAPIYTTEHGYLTVHYVGATDRATRFSLDFYEGKSPEEAFAILKSFLPPDAVDTKSRALGPRANIRVYASAFVARTLPSTQGLLYLECTGPQPARLCEKGDVSAGVP